MHEAISRYATETGYVFADFEPSEFYLDIFPNAVEHEEVTESGIVTMVVSSDSETVYLVLAGDYTRPNANYRYVNPDYTQTYRDYFTDEKIDHKYFDGNYWADTESVDDIMDKAEAMLNGDDYDERVVMVLDLEQDVLDRITEMATTNNISIDDQIAQLLEAVIAENKLTNESEEV